MNRIKHILSALLCVCILLSLCACGQEEPPASTGATTAPTTPAPTVQPTEPTVPSTPEELYADAKAALQAEPDRIVRYSFDRCRLVGSDIYMESRTGTGSYTSLHTEDMEALISEDVSYGSYSTVFTESYISGSAYTRVNGCNFSSPLSAEDFLANQIPAVLMDETLYGTVTLSDDGITFTFSDATAVEHWLEVPDQAELVSAGGTATVDSSGRLSAGTYHAEYKLGTTVYALDVEVAVEFAAPDLSGQPEYPENCPQISDPEIPRYVLRTVGDVYSSKNMSASSTDTLYFGILAETRSQTSSFNTYGSADDFMSSMQTQVSVTNSIGVSSTESQSGIFRNGQYRITVNGGDPVIDLNVTAQQARINCEDSILSSLFPLDFIANAEITETDDFLHIHFQGNDSYIQSISSSIFALYITPLDSMADSHSTEAAGGYLVISKHTGFPTAMGMDLSRTHVFDGVSYKMTYQLDQAVTLSSAEAYQNITGELPEVTASTESAAPLFYKVTGADGQTLWLLGSIHIGDGRTASLPQQISDAFAGADALAIEYDPEAFEAALLSDPELLSQLSAAYYYSEGTVADRLTEDQYEKIYPLMLATGSDHISSKQLKIAIWTSTIENLYLQQSHGVNSAGDCDRLLLGWAATQDKPVYEIESGLSQILTVTGFSDELQAMLLEQLVDQGMDAYCDQLEQQYELWCQGDEAGLIALREAATAGMSDDQLELYSEYYEAVYTDRTKVMLSAVTGYLESGETVFCAVDIDNLLGEDGLVAALTEAGYTVETVTYE